MAENTKPSSRNFWRWILSAIALVFLAMLIFSVTSNSEKKFTEKENDTPVLELNVPSEISRVGSFAVNKDGAVIPHSEVDPSKIRIEFIFDLHCGGCKFVEIDLRNTITKLRESSEVQLYYTPVSFMEMASRDDYSARASSALITVAEYDPENFVAFLEKLYEKFPSDYPTSGVSYDEIAIWAEEIGVSQEAIDRFSDQEFRIFAKENVAVQEDRVEIFTDGKISTPTILIGGTMDENDVLSGFIRVPFRDYDVEKAFREALSSAIGEVD